MISKLMAISCNGPLKFNSKSQAVHEVTMVAAAQQPLILGKPFVQD